MKKTIKRIVSLLCMLCLLASVWLPLLPAAPAERAKAAPASVSREVTVTDGSRYIVTVSYDTAYLVSEDVELRVAELTEADEGYSDYLARSAEALGAEEESIQFARALDISLYDPATGEELQPTGSVSVSITLPDTALEESGNVSVVHFGEEPEVLPAEVSENAVTFETEGFSVYLVVAHEGSAAGNPVETPRVEFHFLSHEIDAEEGGQYTSGFYSFPNKGDGMQTSQILRNGETMEMVANPPNKGTDNGVDSKYFFGWYLVSGPDSDPGSGPVTYTWSTEPDKLSFEKPMKLSPNQDGTGELTNVKVGDTLYWQIAGVKGSGTVDGEGLVHAYLAPLYQDYYFINFHVGALGTELAESLLFRQLVVLGSDNSSREHIGHVTAVSADSQHQIFSGWRLKDPANTVDGKNYHRTVDTEGQELDSESGTETLGDYYLDLGTSDFDPLTHALDLYPVYVEARWLNFNVGPSHNGAEYVPSQYLLTNNDGSGTSMSSLTPSSRPGYAFLGWYADVDYDADTGELRNLTQNGNVTVKDIDGNSYPANKQAVKLSDENGALIGPFVRYAVDGDPSSKKLYEVASDGKLYVYTDLDELTLYARWKPTDVNYTVAYWLENANDDNYTLFLYDNSRTGLAGSRTQAAEIPSGDPLYTENKLRYFHLSQDQDKAAKGMQNGIQNTEIAGDGSTIVNVYYDRDVYTLRFDIGFSQISGGTLGRVKLSDEEKKYYIAPMYGQDGDPVYYYETLDGEDTVRFFAREDKANGSPYGLVDGKYLPLTLLRTRDAQAYSPRYLYTLATSEAPGVTYYGIDGSANYVELETIKVGTKTEHYLSQSNNPGSAEYTGMIYNNNGAVVTSPVYNTQYYNNSRHWNSDRLYWLTRTVDEYALGYRDADGDPVRYSGPRYTRADYSGDDLVPKTLVTERANSAFYYLDEYGEYGCAGAYVQAEAVMDTSSGNQLTVSIPTYSYTDREGKSVTYSGQVFYLSEYTGDVYRDGIQNGGSPSYYVSNITNSNNANNDTWNDFLKSNHWVPINNPFSPSVYNGTYVDGISTIYYLDITAKYGENIYSRYPGAQDVQDSDGTKYSFVGWLAQDDSFYSVRTKTSLKGFFETVSEDLILTGGTVPANYSSNSNATADSFVDITVNDFNTKTGEYGITQEFHCRYSELANDDNKSKRYLYRIYLWDPNLDNGAGGKGRFPTTDELDDVNKHVITGGGGSNPSGQTAPTYYGYKYPPEIRLLQNAAGTSWVSPGDTNFNYNGKYSIPELAEKLKSPYDTGKILEFYFRPNEHTISFWYGSGVTTPNTALGSFEGHTSSTYDYYYGQSLESAMDNAKFYYNQIKDSPLKLEGYYFDGWYENPDGTGEKFRFGEVDGDGDPITDDSVAMKSYDKMRDGDLVLYAVFKPQRFRVMIDPNGGEIDHINHDLGAYAYPFRAKANGSYNTSASTYFRINWGELIGYYDLSRNYVEITQAEAQELAQQNVPVYYYLNTQYTNDYDSVGYDLEADLRNALYLTEAELTAYHDFYSRNEGLSVAPLDFDGWKDEYLKKNDVGGYQLYRELRSGEKYSFLGWFRKTGDTVSSIPFVFSQPTNADVTLQAGWRLDSSIVVEYVPYSYVKNNTVRVNGLMPTWQDLTDASYVDGAETVIYRQPTGIQADDDDEYIFRGWALVRQRTAGETTTYDRYNGVYYDPGDEFTIDARYAQEVETTGGDKQLTIFLQAIYEPKSEAYRRPEAAQVTLDANTQGHVTGTLPVRTSPGTATKVGDQQIQIMGLQSNDALFLSEYTRPPQLADGIYGNFKHDKKYFLLGFDKIRNENDFIADFPADGLISNWRNDGSAGYLANKIAYAVWEPMVYLNLVNDTGVGEVSFTLFAEGLNTEALAVVNRKTGEYSRLSATNQEIVVPRDGSVSLVFPYGAERKVTLKGTNSLGPGQTLIWDSSVTLGGTEYVNTSYSHETEDTELLQPHSHTLAGGTVENTELFSIDAELIEDINGVTITFTSNEHPYTLVLVDNYPGGKSPEYYPTQQEITDDLPFDLETPSNRFPYAFTGYHSVALPDNDTTTVLDYDFLSNASQFRIEKIGTFFGSEKVMYLYAAWRYDLRAEYTLVNKVVPDGKGDQNRSFDFTVSLSGSYKRSNGTVVAMADGNNAEGANKMSASLTLKHDQYLEIHTTKYTGDANEEVQPWIQAEINTFNLDGTSTGDPAVTIIWKSQNKFSGNVEFDGLAFFTVTEGDCAYYDTALSITAETTDGLYDITSAPKTLKWGNTHASGAIAFTNTRQVADVTVKKAIGNTESGVPPMDLFHFSASYEMPLSEGGTTVALSDFYLDENGEKLLEDVPVGSVLTVQEQLGSLSDSFTTTAAAQISSSETPGVSSYDGTSRSYELEVTKKDEGSDDPVAAVTFTNTLKSFPVTIVLVDQDGAANCTGKFQLDSDWSNLRPDTWTTLVNNTIYQGRFYANHSYSLKETIAQENYLPLEGTVTFDVTAAGLADPNYRDVEVTQPTPGNYLIKITNRRTVKIKVAPALKDPMIDRRDFYYTYSYTLDGQSVGGSFDHPVTAYATADGSVHALVTPYELTVPVGATGLTISEDTGIITDPPETVATTYETSFIYNGGTAVKESSWIPGGTVTEIFHDKTLVFLNEKKTVQITLKKSSELEDKASEFSFQVALLHGSTPIKGYTLYDGGVTDSSGVVSFSLQDNATYPDSKKVLNVPVGAVLWIQEIGAVDGSSAAISDDNYVASAAAAPVDPSSTAVLTVSAVPGGGGKTFSFHVPGEDATVTVTNQNAGMDVSFFKIDGYGNKLPGAEFALYQNAACTVALDKTGTSDAGGTVTLSKVPFGVHYMKEMGDVTAADGITWENKNTYVLLVGDAALSSASYAPLGLSAEDIEAQTNNGAVKYAIFLYDTDSSIALTTPDIATFGILNEAEATRRVILRKADKKSDGKLQMLLGAHFRIFRPDLTEVEPKSGTDFHSLSSGVWFSDELHYGKYYLVETVAPGTPAGYGGNAGRVYVLQVMKDGFFDGGGNAVKQLELPNTVSGSTEDAIVSAFKEWRRNSVTP